MSLRERKKADTRHKILETAARLNVERGFDKVTVGDITEAAAVSSSTFFRYFPTKEQTVYPYIGERLKRFQEGLGEVQPGDSIFSLIWRAFSAIASEYNEESESMNELLTVIQSSTHLTAKEAALYLPWEEAIVETIVRHSDPEKVSEYRATVAGGVIFATARSIYRHWRNDACRADLMTLWNDESAFLEKAMQGWAPFTLKRLEPSPQTHQIVVAGTEQHERRRSSPPPQSHQVETSEPVQHAGRQAVPPSQAHQARVLEAST